jgi:hypothetical protein
MKARAGVGKLWEPFGIADEHYGEPDPRSGVRVLNYRPGGRGRGEQKDRAATWLRNAMIALGLLAAAAAVVSFEAQYRMVYAAKHLKSIAALEAGIPDVSAVVFAALGIALALQGRRALRPRALNVAAVATSIGMNYLAAASGWRDAAIWVMPSIAYAVASDTAIGVIRAYVLARQEQLSEDLADDETTPLAVLGAVLLWLLRLTLAAPSTLAGFRAWAVDTCPVAPGSSVAGQRALQARADADQLAISAAAATEDASQARADAETARLELQDRMAAHEAELARIRAAAARTAEEAHTSGQAQVAAAAAERDEAVATAARASAVAEASGQEAQRLREETARHQAQAQAAQREREQAMAAAGSTAQASALARQAAELAQAELTRTRTEAEQHAAQLRKDAERERTELRTAYQASTQALTAGRPGSRAGRGRPGSKRAQLVEAYEALRGADPRYGNRAVVSQVAKELAPAAGLEWGSARTYLYRHLDGQASS